MIVSMQVVIFAPCAWRTGWSSPRGSGAACGAPAGVSASGAAGVEGFAAGVFGFAAGLAAGFAALSPFCATTIWSSPGRSIEARSYPVAAEPEWRMKKLNEARRTPKPAPTQFHLDRIQFLPAVAVRG